MEQLLHYVWKHKMFPLKPLTTTDGQPVEVIDSGLHNYDAGPDFFNAKIKIGSTLWVGNVEIHDKASDWFAHGHEKDERYDNVILHVCGQLDAVATTQKGDRLLQMQLEIPPYVTQHYDALLAADRYPPCHSIIPNLSHLMLTSWLTALQTERLEQKTEAILRRVTACNGSWEAACFVTLARNYGFGINGEAFEQWALSIPLQAIAHHRDNLFQIEAIFLGQAGLLNLETVPVRHRDEALADGYFSKLQNEYTYLQHKFNLKPIDSHLWRFLRLRPQNFPHIRIAQLARLYAERRAGLSQLLECETVKAAMKLLGSNVTPYWEAHYGFGVASEPHEKRLSTTSLQLLVVNTVVPLLFAYGRHINKESLCERALGFLEELRAEDNRIVRMWRDCGLQVTHAGDAQALIQLKNEYCDKKECLRCRIGYEYLKRNNEQIHL